MLNRFRHDSRLPVNRLPNLTHDRRPILTLRSWHERALPSHPRRVRLALRKRAGGSAGTAAHDPSATSAVDFAVMQNTTRIQRCGTMILGLRGAHEATRFHQINRRRRSDVAAICAGAAGNEDASDRRLNAWPPREFRCKS